jgi:hypothetical protein
MFFVFCAKMNGLSRGNDTSAAADLVWIAQGSLVLKPEHTTSRVQ